MNPLMGESNASENMNNSNNENNVSVHNPLRHPPNKK